MLIPFPNLAYLLQQQQLSVPRYYTRPSTQYQYQAQTPAATQDSTYIYTQVVPAVTWTINHNLGQFPSVTLTDTSGNVVLAEVRYINSNQIQVTFSQAFAGNAYLNV